MIAGATFLWWSNHDPSPLPNSTPHPHPTPTPIHTYTHRRTHASITDICYYEYQSLFDFSWDDLIGLALRLEPYILRFGLSGMLKPEACNIYNLSIVDKNEEQNHTSLFWQIWMATGNLLLNTILCQSQFIALGNFSGKNALSFVDQSLLLLRWFWVVNFLR